MTLPPLDTTVHQVIVSPATAALKVGATLPIAASVDAGAAVTDRAVTWSTSDRSVAAVDKAGVVTGVATGAARIVAASRADTTVKAAATISVIP